MVVKLLIFDLGGVIVDFKEENYMHYMSRRHGFHYQKFRAALMPLIDRMEKGKIEIREVEKIVAKKLGVTPKKLEWAPSFSKVSKLNRKVFELIEDLSKSYDVVVLTNNSFSRYEEAKRMFLDNLHVDKIYASCYMGMRKPDPRIYKSVLRDQKAKPEEAIFIDNMPKNVKGARKVGIDSILFKNYKQLAKSLEKRGIVV